VANEAVALLREGHQAGELQLSDRETPWLDMLQMTIDELPDNEAKFIDDVLPTLDTTRFRVEEYELDKAHA
jgi:hypothetical protein